MCQTYSRILLKMISLDKEFKPGLLMAAKCDRAMPSSHILPIVAEEWILKQSALIVRLNKMFILSEAKDTYFGKL